MDYFRRTVIVNSSIIAGSALVIGILLYMLGSYMDTTSKSIMQKRAALSFGSGIVERFSNLKRDAAVAERIQKDIDALLPPQEELISFPGYLEEAGRVYGLSISFSFDGNPTTPGAGQPGFAYFTVSTSGSLARIVEFLKNVETKSTKFIVGFDSTDISASGDVYRAKIGGRVFFEQ